MGAKISLHIFSCTGMQINERMKRVKDDIPKYILIPHELIYFMTIEWIIQSEIFCGFYPILIPTLHSAILGKDN